MRRKVEHKEKNIRLSEIDIKTFLKKIPNLSARHFFRLSFIFRKKTTLC